MFCLEASNSILFGTPPLKAQNDKISSKLFLEFTPMTMRVLVAVVSSTVSKTSCLFSIFSRRYFFVAQHFDQLVVRGGATFRRRPASSEHQLLARVAEGRLPRVQVRSTTDIAKPLKLQCCSPIVSTGAVVACGDRFDAKCKSFQSLPRSSNGRVPPRSQFPLPATSS